MNLDQTGGIFRTVLAFLGGILVSKGWIPAPLMNEIAGGLATIFVAVWSWKTNSTPAMVASVAEKPEVQKVVAPSLADQIPATNVTRT